MRFRLSSTTYAEQIVSRLLFPWLMKGTQLFKKLLPSSTASYFSDRMCSMFLSSC